MHEEHQPHFVKLFIEHHVKNKKAEKAISVGVNYIYTQNNHCHTILELNWVFFRVLGVVAHENYTITLEL